MAVSAGCFGSVPLLARTVYQAGADQATLLAFRFLVAAVLLAAVSGLAGEEGSPRPAAAAAAGGLFAATSLCYFTAIRVAPVGVVVTLLFAYPLVVAAARWRRYGGGQRVILVTAAASAVVGCALVAGARPDGTGFGAVLALLAAVLYAGYVLTSERFLAGAPPLRSGAGILAFAACISATAVSVQGVRLPGNAKGWTALLAISVLLTAVPLVAFLHGVRELGSPAASLLSTLEPVVAAGLGVVVLSESLSGRQLAGCGLVLIAAAAAPTLTPRGRDPRAGGQPLGNVHPDGVLR